MVIRTGFSTDSSTNDALDFQQAANCTVPAIFRKFFLLQLLIKQECLLL